MTEPIPLEGEPQTFEQFEAYDRAEGDVKRNLARIREIDLLIGPDVALVEQIARWYRGYPFSRVSLVNNDVGFACIEGTWARGIWENRECIDIQQAITQYLADTAHDKSSSFRQRTLMALRRYIVDKFIEVKQLEPQVNPTGLADERSRLFNDIERQTLDTIPYSLTEKPELIQLQHILNTASPLDEEQPAAKVLHALNQPTLTPELYAELRPFIVRISELLKKHPTNAFQQICQRRATQLAEDSNVSPIISDRMEVSEDATVAEIDSEIKSLLDRINGLVGVTLK